MSAEDAADKAWRAHLEAEGYGARDTRHRRHCFDAGYAAGRTRGVVDTLAEIKQRVSRFSHRQGHRNAVSPEKLDELIERAKRGDWPPKEER